MLAFLFWHRPSGGVSTAAYRAALTAYHRSLVGMDCRGFHGSFSAAVEAVPWLDGRDGYEDWYLVESSAALDRLNEAGIAPERHALHDAIAAPMAVGHGGLYRHLWGDDTPAPDGAGLWLSRPRGIDFEAPLRAISGALPGSVGAWRKQLVLGPAPEFLLVGDAIGAPAMPEGWRATTLPRRAVYPA